MEPAQANINTTVKSHLRILKNQVVRAIIITMGVLLALVIFVSLLVFIIPKTNMFRFSDTTPAQVNQK
jgi:hypothetical protein